MIEKHINDLLIYLFIYLVHLFTESNEVYKTDQGMIGYRSSLVNSLVEVVNKSKVMTWPLITSFRIFNPQNDRFHQEKEHIIY